MIYRNGRLDFTALPRRIYPSPMHAARRGAVTPATFVHSTSRPLPGIRERLRPGGRVLLFFGISGDQDHVLSLAAGAA